MTADRRAELVEKVAVCVMDMTIDNHTPKQIATAAIDLIRAEVLEEAAKKVEEMEKVFAPQQVITDRCAAAIRALKQGDK